MSRILKFFIFFFILSSYFFLLTSSARAQIPQFSIATTYDIIDPDIADGDIVSLVATSSALKRSNTSYDELMHGVYVKNPQVVYRSPGNEFPVSRTGEINVNVTTLNGEIKAGEYVSSSEIPGKGQRATDFTGYMLGVALQSFTASSGAELKYEDKTLRQGQIKVAVGIGPASPSVIKASGGLFGTIRFLGSSLFYNIANSKQAERLIKIILAILVALTSIILSINYFGKNVSKGIESIGRNPLAKTTIQTMIVINVILIGLIAIGGIIIALVIISI